MQQQQEFDFHRGDQLGLLRSIQLPEGCGVSNTACKAVLRAIDDFGRECFASIQSVAASANVSERVAKRAISRLVELSLITREKRKNTFGIVTNHYRIVWSEVELLCRVDRPSFATERVGRVGQTVGPFATDRGAMMAERGAICDRPWGHGGTQSERSEKDPPRSGASAAAVVLDSWSEEETVSAIALLSSFLDRPRSAIEAAKKAGLAPKEVGQICAEFQANRPLFRSGGAILDRIRNGSWPVAGVKSIEELASRSKVEATAKRKVDIDRIRYELSREWKATGRWESATESEIEEAIQRIAGAL